MTGTAPQANERGETESRIRTQREIVAALTPGSPQHELATRVLLLLQDSLHVLTEIDALLAEAKRLGDRPT